MPDYGKLLPEVYLEALQICNFGNWRRETAEKFARELAVQMGLAFDGELQRYVSKML